MKSKQLAAVVAVFVTWSVIDFIIHGNILASSYAQTANFWRPMPEMKMGLMRVVVLVASCMFVTIYAQLLRPKSLGRGAMFGLLYGISVGIGMGYGTYAVMPIPYSMALTWFLGSVLEGVVAGMVVGRLIQDC